jgi:small nuclear ribonucleoprotein (snRNP)-like protein
VEATSKGIKGAQVVITKTDGTEINGELIAVKRNSTLLLESSSGIGESIDILDINILKVKKSKILAGAGLGLLEGAAAGALVCFVGYAVIASSFNMFGTNTTNSTEQWRAFGGGAKIGGLTGALIGAIVGLGHEETILIRGKSPEEIKKVTGKLLHQARFPEYK